jgi:exo-beta-1,3-glucanase (GH17 family)
MLQLDTRRLGDVKLFLIIARELSVNIIRSRSSLFLIIGCLLLAGAGSALAGPFVGIDYGPFHLSGQQPGTPIPDSQFVSDLSILSQKFTFIKTYGDDSPSRLDRVVPIAAAQFKQLKIYQGVFENSQYNSSANTTYLDTAINLANAYPQTVVAVVVGNECLNTDSNPNPISVSQLISDLEYVRSRLRDKGQVQVTTELGYQAAVQYGQQLKPHVDSMMINIYPFYAPVPIDGAIANLINAYNMFNGQFNGKQVIIGETGWPSAGSSNGVALPSVLNEQTYTRGCFSNANKLGSNFLFSAFDEPWLSVQNSWGPHWGLWDSSGNAKFIFTARKDAAKR